MDRKDAHMLIQEWCEEGGACSFVDWIYDRGIIIESRLIEDNSDKPLGMEKK